MDTHIVLNPSRQSL